MEVARASGRPIFPAVFTRDAEGRWVKETKVRWSGLTSADNDRHDWRGANGCGIMMGGDIHAIDFDSYKEGFAMPDDLPPTRVHRSGNGGEHWFYRTPTPLRSCNGLKPGVDTRGDGGVVFFGAPYGVIRDVPWDDLPMLPDVWRLAILQRNNHTLTQDGPYPLPRDVGVLKKRVARAIRMTPNGALARRWAGDTAGLADPSASGLEMAMATILALHGFDYDDIVHLLMSAFEHGLSAKYGPDGKNVDRQQRRCASRAIQHAQEAKEAQRQRVREFRNAYRG